MYDEDMVNILKHLLIMSKTVSWRRTITKIVKQLFVSVDFHTGNVWRMLHDINNVSTDHGVTLT